MILFFAGCRMRHIRMSTPTAFFSTNRDQKSANQHISRPVACKVSADHNKMAVASK
jgi:hypothetical protein